MLLGDGFRTKAKRQLWTSKSPKTTDDHVSEDYMYSCSVWSRLSKRHVLMAIATRSVSCINSTALVLEVPKKRLLEKMLFLSSVGDFIGLTEHNR